MAWSFRRRVKLIPGVKLNFSKKGITTSIGFQGASVTLGNDGAYINTSIPGLGIYNRQKISSPNKTLSEFESNTHNPVDFTDEIRSSDIEQITSQNMGGIKEAIILARHERNELKKDIKKTKRSFYLSSIKLIFSYLFLYGILNQKISDEIKDDLNSQKTALSSLKILLEKCYVNIDIEFDDDINQKYLNLSKAFQRLKNSNYIWDVTNKQWENSFSTRAAYDKVYDRKKVNFDLKNISEVKSKHSTLYLENANGPDMYFYPTFIITHIDENNFAIIGYDEIIIDSTDVRFVEEDVYPRDSKLIEYTWKRVNKNGMPDKRFRDNYQIPIYEYCSIIIKSSKGLNEEYLVSNLKNTDEFVVKFKEYQNVINKNGEHKINLNNSEKGKSNLEMEKDLHEINNKKPRKIKLNDTGNQYNIIQEDIKKYIVSYHLEPIKLSTIINKIKSKEWIHIDNNKGEKNILIFLSDDNLLMEKDGKITKCKWHIIEGGKVICIDTNKKQLIYNVLYIDESKLILKMANIDYDYYAIFSEEDKNVKTIENYFTDLNLKILNK